MDNKHFLKPCPICRTDRANHERTLNNIELLKCSNCDFIYANMKAEDIKADNIRYDTAVERYEQQQTFIDTMWFERIVKKLTNMVGTGTVLDVGCGNGILLKNFMDKKWRAYGLDLSLWAKEPAEKFGYTLYSCELENADIADNYFDVVTSTSTLEHISEPYTHVRHIIRVLKPGGIAYFCGTPNYGALPIRLNISSFFNNAPPDHVNYFTSKSIRRMFSNPEITGDIKKLIIRTYGIPELHRAYTLLRKIMPKPGQSNLACQSPQPKWLIRAFSNALISINYNLTRPFHLGDKLEIIVVKR